MLSVEPAGITITYSVLLTVSNFGSTFITDLSSLRDSRQACTHV